MGEQQVEHYFTGSPASSAERRPLHVRLAGRDLQLETSSGIFSPDRVDAGTHVLLREAPPPPMHGNMLDLGCGWGPVSLSPARASPGATVWGVDVNERALDLLRRNALRAGAAKVHAALPADVPAGMRFAAIWSNPPIRVGKPALHEMLLQWLPRLEPAASAHLVVQRNLGSDSLHRWLEGALPHGFTTTRHASAKGYRVLRITAP